MKKHKPDIALIRKYLNGALSPREMYELERQAQDDPMLMDVMMGMEQGEAGVHRTRLSEINHHIQQRIQQGKAKRIIAWKPWAAAASVVFVLALGGLWLFREKPAEHYIAQQPTKGAETVRPTHGEATTATPAPEKPTANARPSASALPPTNPTPPQVAERLAEQEADTRSTRLAALANVEDTTVYDSSDTSDHVEALAYKQLDNMLAIQSARSKQDTPIEVQANALSGRAAGIHASGKQPHRLKERSVITGIVVDEATNEPLPGARVKIGKADKTTITDSSGRFTIQATPRPHTLEAELIGYRQQHIYVTDSDSLTIMLAQDEHALSELVVVGYGGNKKNVDTTAPAPLVGWKEYNQYLREYARSEGDKRGTITLAFIVDGSGTPANIRIVKGLSDALNEKAIRLLRDGSKWQMGNDQEQEVNIKIRFR